MRRSTYLNVNVAKPTPVTLIRLINIRQAWEIMSAGTLHVDSRFDRWILRKSIGESLSLYRSSAHKTVLLDVVVRLRKIRSFPARLYITHLSVNSYFCITQ